MRYHWYDYPQVITTFTTYLTAGICLITSGKARKWPGLLTLCTIEAIKSASPLAYYSNSISYKTFFYTYWIASFLNAFAGIAVLADIVRSTPLANLTPRNIQHALIAFAAATGFACIALSLVSGHATFEFWTLTDKYLDHCVALLWGTFAVALIAGITLMGFGLPEFTLRIAWSFILRIAITAGCSYFAIGAHKATYLLIYFWHDCTHTLIAAFWLWAIMQTEPVTKQSPTSERAQLAHRLLISLRQQQ